jgi:quercetin 2,3-dioxygenase
MVLEPGARFTLPAMQSTTNRTIYFFAGRGLRVAGQEIPAARLVRLVPDVDVELTAGSEPAEVLLLAGRPIGEPVSQHGPFVMSSPAEIQQAFADYRRTGFGGWPWPTDEPVHARDAGRFARHADGHVERPDGED